ncbi:hypothetical protein Z517_10438 [Fonsecaea pedrosoi CBS 271.37]|uniref:DNA2/NAM7 helicase-like C-terminal domain-containing protein n=1 Tax=Fonsecaea pedrosoi CBS 271.37 TaxID=1442368 RepID=A0A0D2DDE4_9EURO|nr:uncharacterized protein Z517_10438 [Fonsecaea pedrosoi CBS 271.37]KIW75696.1 hypothetical protein Z517_10438 [Fonsecaea pedrosoi CBS 271.37]
MPETLQTWAPFFNTYIDPDHRCCLEREDVPDYLEKAKESFKSWDEYVALLGSGALIESALADREKNRESKTPIKLLQHKEGNKTRTICLFKVPRRCQENFRAGDKASAHLTKHSSLPIIVDNSSDSRTDPSYLHADDRKRTHGPWVINILPPVATGPPEVAWATIERRQDANKDGYHDPNSYPVTSFSRINSIRQGRGMRAAIWGLLDEATICARVIPEDRHSIFVYVIRALSDLRTKVARSKDGGISKLLVATCPDDITRLNIFESLSDPSLSHEDGMFLNESQKEAIRFGHDAPAGLVLCHGGPGTGKTHFIIQAVRPFLLDDAKEHRVLLTAASNASADSLATALDGELRRAIHTREGLGRRYVIRLHSIKTEKSVAFRDAKLAREASLVAKKTGPPTSEPSPQPSMSGQAATVLAHCEAYMERKYEGVSDERVNVIELSAGERMLSIAGIRGESPLCDAGRFTEFADLYTRFTNGDLFSSKDWTNLDLRLDELLAHTISHASVICATVGGAADDFCSTNYAEAELIVVDEATRVPEYQMWPLFAFYTKAIGKILVGDPNQLGPLIKGDDTKDSGKLIINPLQDQLEMSLQQRLQSAGFKSAFFNVQYRAVEKIAQIYSNVCYGGLLQHGRTSKLEDDQLAKDIIEHNRETYGIPEPVVFYNIQDATEGRNYHLSRFCKEYVILVLKILQNLFDAGFVRPGKACSIAILTPYIEQKRLLKISKSQMEKQYPAAKDVVLQTVDSVQGMEYDVVIVDPTVVRSPGFLNENRLNVMFSRARYGLYVVAITEPGWRCGETIRAH